MPSILLGRRVSAPARTIGFHHPPGATNESGLLTDATESHVLVIGPTGAGKGVSIAMPNLLNWEGSALALDIKGELTNVSSGYRENALGHEVVAIDPWGKSRRTAATFNPFDILLRAGDDLIDCAFGLAAMFAGDRSLREPFWDDRAIQLVTAAIIDIATSRDFSTRSVHELWDLLHAEDVVLSLAVRLDEEELHPFTRAVYAQFISTAENTRSGILTTAQNHLTYFAGPAVQRALARTSFDLDKFAAGGPITIYLVMPLDRVKTHAPVMRVILSALMTLITSRERRPTIPTMLLLDEVAQLGEMPQIEQMVTVGRGYGCRAVLIVQSVEQLRANYATSYRTIVSNCATTVVFTPNLQSDAVEAAESLGDITTDALYHTGEGHIAIKQRGKDTVIAGRLNYLTDEMFKGRFSANPLFDPAPPAAPRRVKRTSRPRDISPEPDSSREPNTKPRDR